MNYSAENYGGISAKETQLLLMKLAILFALPCSLTYAAILGQRKHGIAAGWHRYGLNYPAPLFILGEKR